VLVMMNAIEGALAPWEPDLVEELERLGYARRTAVTLMKLAGRLSRWLEERGLSAYDLSIEVVEQFLDGLRAEGTWFHPTAKTLDWLLGYLREVGVVTPPVLLVPTSWEEKLIEQYRCYLITERGLASETAKGCVRTANLFLADHHGRQIGELTPADVSRFMTRRCRHLSATSRLATGLRSFLAFLRLEGLVVAPLADAVLSAANWSGAALPRGLTADQVTRLLATCDNQRPTSRRDYAILVMLIRLGLRAAEVAGLRLDDIEWRAGQVVVRGKGGTEECLPLPADVGAAIAAYLHHDRPQRVERELFLRAHAPLRGLSPDGVSEVVRTAGERAGLGSFGSHRLRHTAATEMLRAGASLAEVAEVLRHRSVATTAIYAKVDQLALSGLAMPWPGCER
jgi:integrase/recombinase XerD